MLRPITIVGNRVRVGMLAAFLCGVLDDLIAIYENIGPGQSWTIPRGFQLVSEICVFRAPLQQSGSRAILEPQGEPSMSETEALDVNAQLTKFETVPS
jgi:hypothetical protein